MGTDARLQEMIDQIYANALTPVDPTPLYARFGQYLGFGAVALVTARSRYSRSSCDFAWGVDLAVYRFLEERFGVTRAIVEHGGAGLRTGEFAFHDELISEAELRSQPWYCELDESCSLVDAVTVCLESSSERLIYLNLGRPAPGSVRAEQRELIRPLVPHWVRATQIYHGMSRLGELERAFGESMALVPMPIVVLDNTGALYLANKRAEDILARHDGIALTRDGLVLAQDAENQRFRQVVRDAIAQGNEVRQRLGGTEIPVSRPSGKRPFRLVLLPLPYATRQHGRRPAVQVVIMDAEVELPAPVARCCAIFGLTRGEAQVALGVMNGKSIEQIAATQGHSISTSRNLLKRAFAKTGVNRQSELTHLMLHSPLFLDPELFEPARGGRLGVSRSN